AYPPTAFRLAGVSMGREVIDDRIVQRYDAQMGAVFLDEVRGLARAPEPLSRTAQQALGYKELLKHLEGRYTIDAALAEAVRRTRASARGQRAWFRRDSRITWLEADRNPLALLPTLLGHWPDR